MKRAAAAVRGLDPWGPLTGLVALAVFLLQGYGEPLHRDQALYAYSGERVADGVAPYESVLTRAGPFGHLVNGGGALLARLLRTDEVLTMRAVMTAVMVAAVWVLYVVGRQLLGSRIAGVAVALSLPLFQQVVDFATDGPREKTTAVLLVTLCVWAVLRSRWALAGVLVALATLTWQPAFFFGSALAGGTLLAMPRRDLVRHGLRFTGGGIVTTALFVLLFWAWGALDALLQCFLLFNVRYTGQASLLQLVGNHPERMTDGRWLDVVLMVAGLVSVMVVAAVALVRRRGAPLDPTEATKVGLGLGALVGTLWSLFVAGQGWPDLMFLAPAASVGMGALVRAVAGRVEQPRVAPAYAVVAALVAGLTATVTRPTGLDDQRRQVDVVLAAAPEDATVASVNAPQVLALAGLVNPNPYQMFVGGFADYYREEYPGGTRALRELFESENPTFIAVGDFGWHAFVTPLLRERYTLVLESEYLLYVRTDVGRTTIESLRRAARGGSDAAATVRRSAP